MSAPDAFAAGGQQDDAMLIEAERQLAATQQKRKECPDADEVAWEALCQEMDRLEDFICTTRPITLPGCAVKMRLLCHPELGPAARDLFDVHEVALKQVREFIEAQAGGPAMSAVDATAEEEARELAAIDFEPVDNVAMIQDFSEPTYSKMMADIGIDLRISATMLGSTKAKLVEFARNGIKGEADPEDFYLMLERLGATAKRLGSLHDIAVAAFARLNSAASVVAVEGEPE
jgi:hypothetical protein